MELPTVFVPGPLHPDLFGGETPIMVPVKVRAYEVRVTWMERDSDVVRVVARDKDAAEDAAEERAVPFDAEVEEVEVLRELAPTEITQEMIEDYRRRGGEV